MGALGRSLVKALLHEKNLGILKEKDVSENDLFDDAKIALRWVLDYHDSKGSWPTETMVEETIGNTLPEDLKPLDFVAENIRKRSLATKLEGPLRKAAEYIDARDPDKSIAELEYLINHIRSKSKASSVISYRHSGGIRYDQYKYAKENKGLIGIPTPFPTLNGNIQGWVNGWMHVVAAMANTGKSWFECICAEHSERTTKKKVLFVTLEMEAYRILRRIDALRYKIPFGQLRDANMDSISEDEWKRKLDEYGVEKGVCPVCKGSKEEPAEYDAEGKVLTTKPCTRCEAKGEIPAESDIIIADKQIVQTVGDVTALIRQHEPAICYIDGGYRFEARSGQGGSNNWEKTVNIVNEIQFSAEKTNIPWVVTTQFGDSEESGKEKKKGKHVRPWNVRYGKEWFINPDVLLGLYQDDECRLMNVMEVHTLKMRDADKITPMFSIQWNMETMNFEQIEMGKEGGFMTTGFGDEPAKRDHEVKF